MHDFFAETDDIEALDILGIPNATGSPERRLILAILERAILDYVGNDAKEAEEAENWLFSDSGDCGNRDENDAEDVDDSLSEVDLPFSFPWVCQQLDLDACGISEQIRAMPKRGKSRIAPWYLNKAAV